ncbi:hypothetical protein HDV02_003349 [Globomyces sp. JEL0801]|nr:hypothetical protein HDV02_003349 [Globomyces sp. JEL0801]
MNRDELLETTDKQKPPRSSKYIFNEKMTENANPREIRHHSSKDIIQQNGTKFSEKLNPTPIPKPSKPHKKHVAVQDGSKRPIRTAKSKSNEQLPEKKKPVDNQLDKQPKKPIKSDPYPKQVPPTNSSIEKPKTSINAVQGACCGLCQIGLLCTGCIQALCCFCN